MIIEIWESPYEYLIMQPATFKIPQLLKNSNNLKQKNKKKSHISFQLPNTHPDILHFNILNSPQMINSIRTETDPFLQYFVPQY